MGNHIFPLFQAHISVARFAFRVVRIGIVGRIVFCFLVFGCRSRLVLGSYWILQNISFIEIL